MKGRQWIFVTITCIGMLTGCSSLLNLLPIPGSETDPASAPVCVAHYHPLTPVSEVGEDGCGNFWVRRDGHCYILVDSVMVELPKCPAEGDTLGDGR